MKTIFLIFPGLMTVIFSCTRQPDFEEEKKAIMVLHDQQRQAHFEKNVELLLAGGSEDFMDVNRGMIRKPTREESTKRLQSYFDAVEFVKWDDVSPPIFSFSDDATMATTIVDKLVVLKVKDEDNRLDTTHFAWLAVYKKNNGKWQLHRVGSTNQ